MKSSLLSKLVTVSTGLSMVDASPLSAAIDPPVLNSAVRVVTVVRFVTSPTTSTPSSSSSSINPNDLIGAQTLWTQDILAATAPGQTAPVSTGSMTYKSCEPTGVAPPWQITAAAQCEQSLPCEHGAGTAKWLDVQEANASNDERVRASATVTNAGQTTSVVAPTFTFFSPGCYCAATSAGGSRVTYTGVTSLCRDGSVEEAVETVV